MEKFSDSALFNSNRVCDSRFVSFAFFGKASIDYWFHRSTDEILSEHQSFKICDFVSIISRLTACRGLLYYAV